MNCEEFWKSMPELAGDARDLSHLDGCEACAGLWDRQMALAAGLHRAAREWTAIEAPARVEARLTAAFRGNAGMGRRSRPSQIWVPVAAWAAAAAVLVALAMFLVSARQPQAPRQSRPRTAEMAMAQIPEAAMTESPFNSDEYIPLPNAARIAPNEEVNLVRLEVPRSTMIGLGFAVSAERAADTVEAEVVLGTDGLARAVRFLEEAQE